MQFSMPGSTTGARLIGIVRGPDGGALPPSPLDWLAEALLAYFLVEIVNTLEETVFTHVRKGMGGGIVHTIPGCY
jgi:hypothetical protein